MSDDHLRHAIRALEDAHGGASSDDEAMEGYAVATAHAAVDAAETLRRIEGLLETADILRDPAMMAKIAQSERDIAAGRTSTLAEVRERMAQAPAPDAPATPQVGEVWEYPPDGEQLRIVAPVPDAVDPWYCAVVKKVANHPSTKRVVGSVVLQIIGGSWRRVSPAPAPLTERERVVADGLRAIAMTEREVTAEAEAYECPCCPDGHTLVAHRGALSVRVAKARFSDGQPLQLVVTSVNGHHVSEADAEWLRNAIHHYATREVTAEAEAQDGADQDRDPYDPEGHYGAPEAQGVEPASDEQIARDSVAVLALPRHHRERYHRIVARVRAEQAAHEATRVGAQTVEGALAKRVRALEAQVALMRPVVEAAEEYEDTHPSTESHTFACRLVCPAVRAYREATRDA